MAETLSLTVEDMHRKMAVDLYNLTWTFLSKEDRSEAENETMLQAAYASRYHWGVVGTEINFERGDWQISRVFAFLGNGPAAIRYAQRCLDLCLEFGIGDFDLAYAYEALMRGHLVIGDEPKAREYEQLARNAADHIAKEEDKNWFLKELEFAIKNPVICLQN
ncbi:hypothetical protein [Tumebacillus permanentifrigoris]|uniref:Uncharacterized protein n=1 Tax=Tumebacillus permanentifrigoris TaxID=378543 RepID=A0A316D798_9BACL|nr:hypothetical protein [Tumebacillus permanentifrigoris]PWK08364.1 hypothetical protein C7459_11515 [Tumebacillus permanentifrigoris]